MKKLRLSWLALGAIVLALTTEARAQGEPFYDDKTIRVVVGLSSGGGYDRVARALAKHMPKHISGNPEMIVQNMAGAGSVIAANFVYGVAKADGLTLLAPHNNLYLSQLAENKEVKFDLRRFHWIGAAEKDDMKLFMRSDAPYKSVHDLVRAKQAPRCGSTGVGSSDFVMSNLLEETIGAKIENILGYPGSSEIALALERGEVQCMGLTVATFFSREPFLNWQKTNFTRALVQSGKKREARLKDAPTLYELMDQYKTPAPTRRFADAMLLGGDWARPLLAAPGTPADRVKILREAYDKTMKDPEFLAEAKKLRVEIESSRGEELQTRAQEVLNQPREIIERVKKTFVP